MIGTRSANFHQGQRSCAPPKQAGQMSALDQLAESSRNLLHRRGRPHMGTIALPWRYDAAAANRSGRITSDGLRSCATPDGRLSSRFCGWSGHPSIAAISINPGKGAMGQQAALHEIDTSASDHQAQGGCDERIPERFFWAERRFRGGGFGRVWLEIRRDLHSRRTIGKKRARQPKTCGDSGRRRCRL